MAMNSINTNVAAYSAQGNIGRASDKASSSIARLSSGNRIVKAADDVAALSTGTVLRTSVTTLKQALLNTNQGSSLLQVADGALGQVVDILQRQKALAVQSGSGSLSDVERSFLNQEFQALSDEINRLADNTKFSSVTLLNGALSGSKAITTNVGDSAATTVSNGTATAAVTLGALAEGDILNINGVNITFTNSVVGTAGAAGKVVIGATPAGTAANLVAYLNSSTDSRLANLKFDNGGTAGVTANWAGGDLNGNYVVAVSAVTGTNFTVATATNRTITAGVADADGLGVDRVAALGAVSGSILANGATAATHAGPAIDVSNIEDNANFIGKLGEGVMGKITATFSAADTAVYSLKVGDITYTTAATPTTAGAAPIALNFTGRDAYGNTKGGDFSLFVSGNGATFGSQGQLDSVVSQINDSLSGVTFTQNRDVTSFQEGEIVTVGGVQVGQFDGLSTNLRASSFENVNIESVKISAPTAGNSDAKFEVVINGETYVSASGTGNQIATNTTITLQSTTNPNNVFTIMTGNTALTSAAGTSLDLGTQEKADAVAAGLQKAFGLDGATAKLSFQVGASVQDSLGVKIDSIKTDSIYKGQSLSVATQAGAALASTAIETALNTVTAIRASVGALQSRFDFAAANVQTSLQNQDAARGALLDTDVTAESTAYATAQVQLQAGIAVLAQANQLPQNLLKLIS